MLAKSVKFIDKVNPFYQGYGGETAQKTGTGIAKVCSVKHFALLYLLVILSSCGENACNSFLQTSSCRVTKRTHTLASLNDQAVLYAKWDQRFSITVDETFDSREFDAALDAIQVWKDAILHPGIIGDLNHSPHLLPIYNRLEDFQEDSTKGLYKINSWFYPADAQNVCIQKCSIIALTQYQVNLSRIVDGYPELIHGDIFLNTERYQFVILNASGAIEHINGVDSGKPRYDVASVLLHELGHFLGIGHIGVDGESILAPRMSPESYIRQLGIEVEDKLHELYPYPQSGIVLFPSKLKKQLAKPNIINYQMALMPDGNCQHFQNGKLVYSHPHSLPARQ